MNPVWLRWAKAAFHVGFSGWSLDRSSDVLAHCGETGFDVPNEYESGLRQAGCSLFSRLLFAVLVALLASLYVLLM
jgi:hypothetical protein